MRAVDVIRHKRDGGTLDRGQIDFFVSGVTAGTFRDYQASALLMAILIRGMSAEETTALTDAMVRSGVRVAYPGIDGTPVDKHSTGGVGDKTSLVLAPLAAACGAYVPMMSGRGLGHTGGTLDKLESIPGFRTGLSLEELRTALAEVNCAIVGQTSEIAPADRKLYALRDVTGTVESIPLICASIMSKKIAEGIGGLVLDVKTGAGAFMTSTEDSRRLAQSLVHIGSASGLRTEALITAMDAPLGRMVGNSLEVIESIETLKGRGPADVEALSVTLAARLLIAAGLERDEAAAEARVREALTSGAALERFGRIIERQGGDRAVVDDYRRLPSTPDRHAIQAPHTGYTVPVHAGLVGRAAVALGAGRAALDDVIDPGVGIEVLQGPGVQVSAGEPVLMLHHRAGRGLAEAVALLTSAVQVEEAPRPARPLILERIGSV